jgi:hypothetical protein
MIYLRFGHWIIFSLTFATAKVLLIFDIRKRSDIFFAFLSKNLPAHTGGMYGELKAF